MMSSRRWRMLSVLPVAFALAGVVGCMEEVGSTKTPDATEGTAQAISPANQAANDQAADGPHGMRPPPGGPEFLLVAALHELDLTQAQKATIQSAIDTAAPGPKEHGPRDRSPFTALAEGVRAGKIDAAAVLAKAGDGHPPEEHSAAVAGALQTLHATLTKEQRRALVDTITKRMAEHGPAGDHPGMKGDHGPGGEHGGPGGPLGHLLSGLNLTDAQRAAIDKALAAQRPTAEDHEAMKKRFEAMHTEMQARLEGFAADTFDAKAFVAPPGGAEAGGPKQHLERMVKDFAVVVPLLEPAQREALAALLEKGPPGPMGPPGAPPR